MRGKASLTKPLSRGGFPKYKNPHYTDEERTADLLAKMTLEEKVAQMLCIWGLKKTTILDENENLSLDKVREQLPNGIGQIGRLSDTMSGLGAIEMAELANTLQKYFVEETRLGIPVIFHEECLHGLAAKDSTSYPQPIGLASTFNINLIEKIYSEVAADARIRGTHQALTPDLDVARDPRWGRVEETFGEDPFLISQMGIAAVQGFQGDGSFKDKKKVLATLKHFAAHGQPESGSNCGPGNFSERVLRDTFLFPFKEVLQKAKPLCVMASYNEIDGIPSHANKWLLRDVLRGEWGFNGFVVSDYYAITELNEREDVLSHRVAEDKSKAAQLAVNAGVNIEFPDIDCYPYLVDLVRSGDVDEALIDELVGSILKFKFKLGLFDNPYVHPDFNQIEQKLVKDRELALRAAQESIVLLQNKNGLLPLKPEKNTTLAVIGPNADRRLLGGYSGEPRYYYSVLQGIKEKAGAQVNILYSEGCKITVNGTWDNDDIILPDPQDDLKAIAEATETAKKADYVILVLGENEQTSREAWSKSHLGDRANLDLFGMQNELVKAVLKTGKPVIVLLFGGRPNSITFIKENVPVILECWYLGQETGRAVADVIFGDYNPSGKLPISFPRSSGHIPCFYNHKPSSRRGYVSEEITSLFPFGYGLSYSKFKFSNLRLKQDTISRNESTKVSIEVMNAGSVAGEEVVQLYIRDIYSSVTRPLKELKGFQKIYLKPNESQEVSFNILPEHLAFTNIEMEQTVEPGDFEIMIGNSSRDEDLVKIILHVKKE